LYGSEQDAGATARRRPRLRQRHERLFFAEKDLIKRDAIAAHQLGVLKDHQGPREKKLWLSDVTEMFLAMRDHA
jgi:hypothetical protein